MVSRATTSSDVLPAPEPQARLRGSERREALLDVARALIVEGAVDSLSMDTVAERAGVSRPLVYKHFANRHELLAEVYRREATAVDAEIVAAVQQANGFEEMIRALIRGMLDVDAERGAVFVPLVQARARDSHLRNEQRARDRRTVRFFAGKAMDEFGLPEREARAAIRILLSGIESVRAQWRARPTRDHRQFLEDLFVDLVVGALKGLRR